MSIRFLMMLSPNFIVPTLFFGIPSQSFGVPIFFCGTPSRTFGVPIFFFDMPSLNLFTTSFYFILMDSLLPSYTTEILGLLFTSNPIGASLFTHITLNTLAVSIPSKLPFLASMVSTLFASE